MCRACLVRRRLFSGFVLWQNMRRYRPPESLGPTRAGPGRGITIFAREPGSEGRSSAPIDSTNPAFWHPSRGASVGVGRVTGGGRFARPPVGVPHITRGTPKVVRDSAADGCDVGLTGLVGQARGFGFRQGKALVGESMGRFFASRHP